MPSSLRHSRKSKRRLLGALGTTSGIPLGLLLSHLLVDSVAESTALVLSLAALRAASRRWPRCEGEGIRVDSLDATAFAPERRRDFRFAGAPAV